MSTSPLTSALSSASNAAAAQSGVTTPPASADPLANESTFLTLLVSQLKNQDPLSPVDSNQFVTQLTQYSQLEQLIGIHSDTTSISKVTTAPPVQTPGPVTPPPATTSSTSQTTSTTGATN